METKIKSIIMWVAAFFAALASVRADTSYLLLQGPFGSGGAEETFQWQINYPTGELVSGMDLLNTILGSPSFSGSNYPTYFGSLQPYWIAGNSTQGAGYINYSGTATTGSTLLTNPFLAAVTLDSTTVAQDSEYINIWNYYVAGGGSNYGAGYANGAWLYSNDGLLSRSLVNGSFDAWVFGSVYDLSGVDGANNAPTAADFSGATVITVVPEPGGAALQLSGMGGVLALYGGARPRRLQNQSS